jgi:hypothetical protein
VELDAGADASADAGDAEPFDAGITDASVIPDADDTSDLSFDADVPDSSFDADAGDGDTTTDSDADSDSDAGSDPIMLMGTGPTFPDPAVDYAGGSENKPTEDGVDDAVFTVTITAPITQLVLVNTDQDGVPYYNGAYYTFWSSKYNVPDEVPVITPRFTPFNFYTVVAGTSDVIDVNLLGGADDPISLDMYVSFSEEPSRPHALYYRLYVFGADGELTQMVDFEAVP